MKCSTKSVILVYGSIEKEAKNYEDICTTRGGGTYLSSYRVKSGLPRSFAPRNDLFAFTLSEVLITLGIIGIVASLTIPSLISKRIEKDTIVKLQKTYTTLQSAFNMAIAENGPVSGWFTADNKNDCHQVWDKILVYMPPIVKDCTGTSNELCFVNNYKNVDGNNIYNSVAYSKGCKAVFSDGVALSINHIAWPYGLFKDLGSAFTDVYVDLNGPGKPNVADKDFFSFTLVDRGVIPTGDENFSKYTWPPEITKMDHPGNKTAWVIYNSNIDYLHCPEKLGWDKAKSCKEPE